METNVQMPSYQNGLKELVNQLGEMLPAESLNTFNQDAQKLGEAFPSALKLKKGDKAPLFSLSNALGHQVALEELLKNGAVVLSFYRGSWCPYCNLQLAQYQQVLDQIKAAGAQLVAISPQNPDHSLSMQEKNALAFEVLSDPGNLVARMYTTVFKNYESSIEEMKKLGLDFDSFYSDDSQELPVPAVFIINQNGDIIFCASEGGDYRQRTEAQTIIEALKA